MGLFSVRAGVSHPAHPERGIEMELLVDAGATLSWIPRGLIEALDVPRLPVWTFLLADGRTIDRETAGILIRVDGAEAIVTVVLGEPGDGQLLGATTLETLGFTVDPVRQRLVRHPLLAMSA